MKSTLSKPIFSLAALALIICLNQPYAATTVFSDSFQTLSNNWKELYLKGSSGGNKAISNGALNLSVSLAATSFGVYHTTPLSGNFYVEAEFSEDNAMQLVLLRNNNGTPDLNNYTSIAITKRSNVVYVNQYDKQNGTENVNDPKGKVAKNRYEVKLGGLTNNRYGFSVPYTSTNKKARLLHENLSKSFHFYFGTRLEKWGFVSNDWMETAPQYSWLTGNQEYFVALICRNESGASQSISFKSIKAVKIPETDQDDSNTGFKVVERPFYWSGHFGTATVVTFGEEFAHDKNIKFTIWDMANNAPAWRINNDHLLNYEFFEGGDATYPGCHEAMSDRQRHGQTVKIIEDNAVRKVVHWHGIPLNPNYNHVGENSGGTQRPYYDEYWTFYPDGTGTRHFIDTPKLDVSHRRSWGPEFIEPMPIGGTLGEAGDLCASPALTIMDLGTNLKQFHPPSPRGNFDGSAWSWKQLIMTCHFKNNYPDFFIAYSQSQDIMDTWTGLTLQGQLDWHMTGYNFSHWPVGRETFGSNTDGGHYVSRSYGTHANEVTHTSLISAGFYEKGADFSNNYKEKDGRKYREHVMLIGVAKPGTGSKDEIRDLVNTWLYPGTVAMLSTSSKYVKNNYQKKELVFDNAGGKDGICNFDFTPGPRPVVKPVFKIENWGGKNAALVKINGVPAQVKYATVDKAMLVWVNDTLKEKSKIEISSYDGGSSVRTFITKKHTLAVKVVPNGFACVLPYKADWQVALYSLKGEQISRAISSGNEVSITSKNLASGAYFIRMSNASENIVHRVFVQ
jgi:hypothetical protein